MYYVYIENNHRKGDLNMPKIEDTLKEREAVHGDFEANAQLSQTLKRVMHDGSLAGISLSHVQAEALEVICAKIARICTGDPGHADHWHDIAGYAKLAEKAIERSSHD